MYDEALAVFARIDPAKVVDPATCLFYRAVCEHQLLRKKEGLATLDKLLHKTEGVAEPYTQVATLMQDELSSLDDQSLDGRFAQDAGFRAAARFGSRRPARAEGAGRNHRVARRDHQKAASAARRQQSQAQQQQREQQQSIESGRPTIRCSRGPPPPAMSIRTRRRTQGTWGGLPPKQVTDAENRLNHEFPSNYRRAVEEYFKKLANTPAGKGK